MKGKADAISFLNRRMSRRQRFLMGLIFRLRQKAHRFWASSQLHGRPARGDPGSARLVGLLKLGPGSM